MLATFGSLGDLHPYVALALELRRRGHEPVIASTDVYGAYVRSLGIEFMDMHPVEAQLGRQGDHLEALFDPMHGPRYMMQHLVMPFVREAFDDLRRAAFDAHAIVTHPLAVAGPLVAATTGLPWISSVLSPLSLFSAVEPPVYPAAPALAALRRLGVWPYRVAFALVKRIAARWERPLQQLRAELGLPPAPPALFDGQFSPALNLALFSPRLAKPQPDWPARTLVCGFARHDGRVPDAAALEALERFLASGTEPIVFTLGSAAHGVAGEFWRTAIHAARSLDHRAILIGPDTRALASEGVATFEYLPYSTVFPHAAACAHQGGIGTLSQALAAGRPQLVVPVAFDQPDNAARAVRLGVARSLPIAQVTGESLVAEVRQLLEGNYAARAVELGREIRAEDGAARAVDAILALL